MKLANSFKVLACILEKLLKLIYNFFFNQLIFSSRRYTNNFMSQTKFYLKYLSTGFDQNQQNLRDSASLTKTLSDQSIKL